MIQATRQILPMRDVELWVDGRRLGRVARAPWREQARLTFGSNTLEIIRESWLGDFLLVRNRRPILRAEPQGLLNRDLGIEDRGTLYTLRPTNPFGSRFLLLRDENPIGQIKFHSTAHAELELDQELPDELLMFVFGLATLLQSRWFLVATVLFLILMWRMSG